MATFSCSTKQGSILIEDSFGEQSQGMQRENVIQLPPPEGLDYQNNVLESGFDPVQWFMVDEKGPVDPKKGFWVIPPDSAFLQQGGRSHNSVLFCKTPVPDGTDNYDIIFRQWRHDNDYIGYIVGAKEMQLEGGLEFGYMTQVPGTDSTTADAYITGALGETIQTGMALMHQWADHRIEVSEQQVRWYVNEELFIADSIQGMKLHGYFGIRQRYERNTRYDDFQIKVH